MYILNNYDVVDESIINLIHVTKLIWSTTYLHIHLEVVDTPFLSSIVENKNYTV